MHKLYEQIKFVYEKEVKNNNNEKITFNNEIKMENVSFNYETNQSLILEGIKQ